MARYTAVGTPELVTSWVADPSLLVSNRGLPQRVVIDELDFQRRQQIVLSGSGDSYDIFVWYWLEFLRQTNFLTLIDFRKIVSPTANQEISARARELSLRVDSAELRDIFVQAHRDWRNFGLVPKEKLKKDDAAYQLARSITEREISRLERGGSPRVDPVLLQARCSAKLLTGVYVAKSLEPQFGLTLVFDAPQHRVFADRMEKIAVNGPELFAMTAACYQDTSDQLRDMMETLNVPLKHTLILGHLELLAHSLDEIMKLQQELGNKLAWHEVKSMIADYHGRTSDKRWEQIAPLASSLIAGIASPPSALFALLAALVSALLIESRCTHLYKEMPAYAKLALTNNVLARINQRPDLEQLGMLALLALRSTAIRIRARLSPHRKRPAAEQAVEAELKRQEISSWVSSGVWYHPHW